MRSFAFILLVFGIAGCASDSYVKRMKAAETKLYDGQDPILASREMIPYINKGDCDQLLYMMEAGMMLHMGHEYEKSSEILIDADKKADLLTKSVSKEITSYFTNETGKPYRGEDYERVFVNMISGYNFLKRGLNDDALVDFKKVNYKLDQIRQDGGLKYKANLMAKYLAYLSASAAGDLDYAYVELKQIQEIQPGIEMIGKALINTAHRIGYKDDEKNWRVQFPKIKIDSKLTPYQNSAEVVLFYESGKAPIKISRGRLLNERGARELFTVSLEATIITQSATGVTVTAALAALGTAEHPIPKYQNRSYSIHHAELLLTSADKQEVTATAVILNDAADTMVRNFEENYQAVRNKMVARISAKLIASLITQKVAEETAKQLGSKGGLSALIGALSGAVVGYATLSAEKPDLRCWHSLPAEFQVASRLVREGKYAAKVKLFDSDYKLIQERDLGEITVTSKQPVMLYVSTTN